MSSNAYSSNIFLITGLFLFVALLGGPGSSPRQSGSDPTISFGAYKLPVTKAGEKIFVLGDTEKSKELADGSYMYVRGDDIDKYVPKSQITEKDLEGADIGVLFEKVGEKYYLLDTHLDEDSQRLPDGKYSYRHRPGYERLRPL